MNSPLSRFGLTSEERVLRAVDSIRRGSGVLLVDDEDRENEGDLIFAADSMTVPQMAQMIRHCSGIVCLCLTEGKADELGLPLMVSNNTSRYGTAFTISIEAAEGVTTGVSASDRIATIRAAVAPGACPEDLSHPGHIFPLRARSGGVLTRPGHTEGTVDLARLAGRSPSGVLCELTNEDGSMARLPEVVAFAEAHGYPVVAIADLADYLRNHSGE